jgi:hypothetical protein
MARTTLRSIPKNIRQDLICLPLLRSQLRMLREADRSARERIEAWMPGAVSLISKRALVNALIQKHNARIEQLGTTKAVRA